MIQIEHNFKTKSHSLIELFDGVRKMSSFMRILEQQAEVDPNRYDRDKYVGDGFEFFVEVFLSLHPADNRSGVSDYVPIQENDNGVDGIGVNIKGEKSVVQIKYRANNQSLLTATQDHLSNMFSDGDCYHQVTVDHNNRKNYRHFIFTTADGLHFYTDNEMYKSKVKCIGYNDFRSMVDNNKPFWEKALEIAKNCNLSE